MEWGASTRDSRRRTAREQVRAGRHFSCSRARSDRRVFSVRDSRARSSSTRHLPPAPPPEGRGRGLQTWPPREACQQAASLRLVPNARPGPGPGSTEACTAASSLSVTRPHPLESYPFFPCDSPPLSCPLPIPASLHSERRVCFSKGLCGPWCGSVGTAGIWGAVTRGQACLGTVHEATRFNPPSLPHGTGSVTRT